MIEVGDPLPDFGISVVDSTGVTADGGVVTVQVTLPDQTVITSPTQLTVQHPATGRYTSFYVAVQPGTHQIVWSVTGANAGTFSDTRYVEQNLSIVSLAEIKSHLKIARTNDDEMLMYLGLTASNLCESPEGTNRKWRRTIYTGELHDGGDDTIRLDHSPVISITSITADGSAVNATDYDLATTTGILYSYTGWWPTIGRRRSISVSYVAGSTTVPAAVRDGVLELVRHLYAVHRGGADLPRQDEPDWPTTSSFLVPYRVAQAWQAYASAGI